MYAFAQFLWDYRAEIFGAIVALDQALAATNKVRANSTGQLFLHSFIASIEAQRLAGSVAAAKPVVRTTAPSLPPRVTPPPPPSGPAVSSRVDLPAGVTT